MTDEIKGPTEGPPTTPWRLFASLRGYRLTWLAGDAVAGLMLVAIVLPGQRLRPRGAGRSLAGKCRRNRRRWPPVRPRSLCRSHRYRLARYGGSGISPHRTRIRREHLTPKSWPNVVALAGREHRSGRFAVPFDSR